MFHRTEGYTSVSHPDILGQLFCIQFTQPVKLTQRQVVVEFQQPVFKLCCFFKQLFLSIDILIKVLDRAIPFHFELAQHSIASLSWSIAHMVTVTQQTHQVKAFLQTVCCVVIHLFDVFFTISPEILFFKVPESIGKYILCRCCGIFTEHWWGIYQNLERIFKSGVWGKQCFKFFSEPSGVGYVFGFVI